MKLTEQEINWLLGSLNSDLSSENLGDREVRMLNGLVRKLQNQNKPIEKQQGHRSLGRSWGRTR